MVSARSHPQLINRRPHQLLHLNPSTIITNSLLRLGTTLQTSTLLACPLPRQASSAIVPSLFSSPARRSKSTEACSLVPNPLISRTTGTMRNPGASVASVWRLPAERALFTSLLLLVPLFLDLCIMVSVGVFVLSIPTTFDLITGIFLFGRSKKAGWLSGLLDFCMIRQRMKYSVHTQAEPSHIRYSSTQYHSRTLNMSVFHSGHKQIPKFYRFHIKPSIQVYSWRFYSSLELSTY